MTINEAIKAQIKAAEAFEKSALEEGVSELTREGRKRVADEHKQLAEWLTELKEAKRLLKAAVEQMAQVGEVCDCIHSQNCPLDECGKFTFHDEIIKLIEG